MYRIANSFWVLVCSYLVFLFGSFFRLVLTRFRQYKRDDKFESNPSKVYHQSNEEREEDVSSSSVSCSKFEFLCGKGISGFIEEPKALSFTVHEVFLDAESDETDDYTSILDPGSVDFSSLKEVECENDDFVEEKAWEEHEHEQEQEQEFLTEEKNCGEEEAVVRDPGFYVDEDFGNNKTDSEALAEESEVSEKQEQEIFTGEFGSDKSEGEHSSSDDVSDEENEVLKKQEQEIFTGETDSDKCEGEHSSSDVQIVAEEEYVCSIEVLANRTVVSEAFGSKNPVFTRGEEVEEGFKEDQCTDADDDDDDEYIELVLQKQNSDKLSKVDDRQEKEDSVHGDGDPKPKADSLEKSEDPILQEKKFLSNSDAKDDTDFMFEHQDIIEQLKLELKQARTGGLPTILEEPESEELETPKLEQKLKPLKIDQKIEHKDFMEEIQKVYKSYSEKMRKLDILNFQTMHALGLLQLTDTFPSKTVHKFSGPAIKSLLSQNIWSSCKQKAAVVEPTKKIFADMNYDFEMVYVGQLCLSWEVLHWQYRKLQDVQKLKSAVSHQYNIVAGEFQLFQVLLQRFIENGPFQGPRVQSYVKNRCFVRNLLQVPVIKDDIAKDKLQRGDVENAITSQLLTESIEDSMRTFWEFLRADKDESNVTLQRHMYTLVNLKDSVDLQFFIDLRNDLLKKEKRVKDILKSGNCIVKKFRKHEDNRRHPSLFIAQVELRLISRVLNMSGLRTDQLIWCHEKLDKIKFCSRKVFVESSFLLFPC